MATATLSLGLELQRIRKLVQNEPHLTDIALRCEPGSFTVLLGGLRAGKTSLLRIIAGLDRPSAGHVFWNGQDVTHLPVRKRDVAMVYQQFVNYPSLSVYENIASPLRIQRRLSASELDRRVRELAERLHIEAQLSRLPAELSGGQQQRTAIARALAKSAKLVLLDEPLANLDYKLREELRSELPSFFTHSESSVVYATAEPQEALWLAGTTAVLHEGRLLQVGPAADVYAHPCSERVASIFSDPAINMFEVAVEDAVLRASGDPSVTFARTGRFAQLPVGSRWRFGVRAHDVRRSPVSADSVKIAGRVALEELSGSDTLLFAQAGSLRWLAHAPGTHRSGLGAPIELFIDPARFLMFDAEGNAPPGADHGTD